MKIPLRSAVVLSLLGSLGLVTMANCGTPPGNVGDGGAGGGGTTGVVDQEVISGSRLKAIVLKGTDGSKAGIVGTFWDSQLQLYCVPSVQGTYPGVCAPLVLAGVGKLFSDAACTQALAEAYPSDLATGVLFPGLPDRPAVHYAASVQADGGTQFFEVGARFTGSVFLNSPPASGGCHQLNPVPADIAALLLGAAVPTSTFAPLTYSLDP